MPDGVKYEIVYDTTKFVRASIEKVIDTLLEAIALVVLVVILFLQTWRASIIPLIAVPVSIIGTFAVMYVFGFSINALSLFGLVLAIGIVVDDAIVVVENVERNIEKGLVAAGCHLQGHEGSLRSDRRDRAGARRGLRAARLHLRPVGSVLPPVRADDRDLDRHLGLQLADAVSGAGSPSAEGPSSPKDWLTRFMDAIFGWFFRGFNRVFGAGSNAYGKGVGGLLSRKSIVMVIYLALVGATYSLFSTVPGGFVPSQDKQYLIGFAQLPDAASLDRTEDVIKRMTDIALAQPGVANAIAFPGLSINGFTNSSNAGIVFVTLKDFEERKTPDLSGGAIAMALNQKFGVIQDAFIAMFPPPPVNGLGTTGGFKLQIEDRAGLGNQALDEATKAVLAKAYQTPELAGLFSSFQINVPQLYADLDRAKAEQLGVSVTDVFQTLQIYLGSLYVNDFNAFGRTYSVRVQADAKFRAQPEDIGQLKVRSASGQMIPLSALLKVDAEHRSGAREPLQRLPRCRYQRRSGTGLLVRSGAGGNREDPARDAACGHRLRMDGSDLSADPGRQFEHRRLPAGPAARLPGAGRPV